MFDTSDMCLKLRAQTQAAAGRAEHWLLAIWERELNTKQVLWTSKFVECGGDAFIAISLLHAIEKVIGRPVDPAILNPHTTPYELFQSLQLHAPAIFEERSKPVVYVLAGSLGCVDDMLRVLSRLKARFNVRIVRYPDLAEEIASPHSVPALGLAAARKIMGTTTTKTPVVLLGLSYGGWIAWETSQILKQRGYSVDRLILVDIAAPGVRSVSMSRRLSVCLMRARARGRQCLHEPIRTLGYEIPRDLCRRFLNLLSRLFLQGRPVERLDAMVRIARVCLSGAALRFTEKRFFSNWRVYQARTWRPHPLTTSLTLFKASHGMAHLYRLPDHLGWEPYATRLEVIGLPGDHLAYTQPPVLDILIEELALLLDYEVD